MKKNRKEKSEGNQKNTTKLKKSNKIRNRKIKK